jgi:Tol biopolymer transport system component
VKTLIHGFIAFATAAMLLSCAMPHQSSSLYSPKQTLFVSNQDGDREIFVANLDGSAQKQLTNNDSDDYEASWSPSGDLIAFTSNRLKGNTEVYLMNADGSNQVNISQGPGFDGRARWSSDGKFIAFNSARNGAEQIYLWERKTGEVTQLTDNPYASIGPVWSNDSQWIAYQNYGESHKPDLWITSIDGKRNRQLTDQVKSEDGAFSWSPDDRKIVFHSRRNYQYNVFIYDLNDNQEVKITNTNTSDVNPVWSTSGNSIAFMSNRGQYGRTQICIMKEDGSEQRCITDSRYQASDPIWLTDNSILHSNWNGKRFANVYLLDITTEQITPVAPATGYQTQPQPRPAVLPSEIAHEHRLQHDDSGIRRNL